MGSEPAPYTDGFAEDRDETGAPRPGYGQLLEALADVDLADLAAAVDRHVEQHGVTFGERSFAIDRCRG